jgi:Tfp pilus assembly protein PilP
VKASAAATQSQAAAKPAAQASKPESKQPGKAAAPVTAKAAAPAKTTAPAVSAPAAATQTATAPKAPKPEEKKWAMNGKRDPFFSPVVQTNGSGCSTGKKCLEIGAINLRGVVKSDTGFIAVVTNNLNKAYFLRENDPVFNGYVVKITGDSVVFQETIQDKLGKPFTREVVKRIFTPAV